MKTFMDFLAEGKKTYEFKIGVAGELPEEFADRMETALQKFGMQKLSPGKKTPIQERPLDFPQLQNMEVTYYQAEVAYPTTPHVLQEYLGDVCGVERSHVIVRSPNEPQELYQQNEDDTKETYEVKLTKQELEGDTAQESVGEQRVMELLKELEAARKENSVDPTKDVKSGQSTDIDNTENTKSTIGA